MANYRSTNDLKLAVLAKCGELTDGSSTYESVVLQYLTAAHQNLLAGGNEFGIDCAEDWAWAKADRSIILTLQAPVTSGDVTVTANSNTGTFSAAPTDALSNNISVAGWYLKIDGIDDFYRIAAHVSGATSFTLDQVFLGASGVYGSWKALQLDYDVIDDTIVVDSTNNKIDFKGTGGSSLVATLTSGVYTPTTYIAHVAATLQSADSGTYTGSWDPITRKFTLAHGSAAFQLLFGSGDNAAYSASGSLGFDVADTASGALTLSSTYVLNAIQRIMGPVTMYREQNVGFDTLSPRDSGKIFGISYDALKREYPISRMVQGTPDRFSVIRQQDNGILTMRINQYPGVQMRAEVDYIPIGRDLQDNANSIPKVPISFREYLMHVATYFLMLDKSDNRADLQASLAKAKLVALINHNRKSTKSSGKDYGRLIPRRTQSRSFIRSTDT